MSLWSKSVAAFLREKVNATAYIMQLPEVDKMPLEDERTSTETEPVRNNDRFDNQTSGGSKIELEVVRKSNTNNNYINNTDINKF